MIGTVAGWIAYASARGDVVPNDATSSHALERASDYIMCTYVERFSDGYDETSDGVENATYEAAKLERETPGFFNVSFTPSQQKVLTEVKGIKWTIPEGINSGQMSAVESARPVSTKIESMLAKYLTYGVGFSVV